MYWLGRGVNAGGPGKADGKYIRLHARSRAKSVQPPLSCSQPTNKKSALSQQSHLEKELGWSKKLVIQVIQVPNNLKVSSTHPQKVVFSRVWSAGGRSGEFLADREKRDRMKGRKTVSKRMSEDMHTAAR